MFQLDIRVNVLWI